MTFLSVYATYAVIWVGIIALAVAGVFFGKYLRIRKDAKEALVVQKDNKEM